MEPKTFAFELGQKVGLTLTLERGIVIGRAEYTANSPQYLVRYAAGDGRQTEAWWEGSALSAI